MSRTPALLRPRSFVLLAGGVRGRSLASRLGRSVLDLPVAKSLRLLDVWLQRIEEFHQALGPGLPEPEVHILAGAAHPLPTVIVESTGPRLHAQRDRDAYRGTAGALRDLCSRFAADDHVLVGTASQCPDAGLIESLVSKADPSAGVTLSAAHDGRPSGLLLVRCEALRQVPPVGFIDLKEQALPRIAETLGVKVTTTAHEVSPPIRDVRSYVGALRSWRHSGSFVGEAAGSPYEERWKPVFSVVEAGAEVGKGARLHDAVVLRGGVVEPGCDVVRSVVGPGGVARRKDVVVDRLVMGKQHAKRTRDGEHREGTS